MTGAQRPILLVEDDAGLQKQMRWSLSDYEVLLAQDRDAAMAIVRREQPGVAIVDLGLPPLPNEAREGLALIESILIQQPETKVIVASGNETRENAVKAVSLGAYDFLGKPVDPDILLLMVRRAFYLLEIEEESRNLQRLAHRSPFDQLIAGSPQMLDVCHMIERVGASDVSVLLTGESGTGKELLARALHDLNDRAKKKFVAINCAAIPDTLLESELFGYERGAFTGAAKQTPGIIEQAHGGTLFLDEIADMPLPLQAKLLRFLQERTIARLGGRQTIEVDTRIVSATNRNLPQAIAEGQFRDDLYYRLAEISIDVPPLRHRDGDAALIAKDMLAKLKATANMKGIVMSDDAVSAVSSYEWPGNVRELRNRVKRAAILANGHLITAADLDLPSANQRQVFPTLRQARNRAEIDIVQRALLTSDFNVSQAAKLLGVSRPTLYDVMRTHGIGLERSTAELAHGESDAFESNN